MIKAEQFTILLAATGGEKVNQKGNRVRYYKGYLVCNKVPLEEIYATEYLDPYKENEENPCFLFTIYRDGLAIDDPDKNIAIGYIRYTNGGSKNCKILQTRIFGLEFPSIGWFTNNPNTSHTNPNHVRFNFDEQTYNWYVDPNNTPKTKPEFRLESNEYEFDDELLKMFAENFQEFAEFSKQFVKPKKEKSETLKALMAKAKKDVDTSEVPF